MIAQPYSVKMDGEPFVQYGKRKVGEIGVALLRRHARWLKLGAQSKGGHRNTVWLT